MASGPGTTCPKKMQRLEAANLSSDSFGSRGSVFSKRRVVLALPKRRIRLGGMLGYTKGQLATLFCCQDGAEMLIPRQHIHEGDSSRRQLSFGRLWAKTFGG